MFPRSFYLLPSMLVAIQIGCAERLPTYPWVDDSRAARLLAERSTRMQTLASPCRVILAETNSGSTQLDGAIVARTPGFLRLRAWKFSQPVLDITLTPEGLWLFTAQDIEHPDHRPSAFAGLTAEQLRRAWSLVTGEAPLDGWTWEDDASSDALAIRQQWDSGGSIDCTIDRHTLALRRCTVTRSADAAPLTLTLDRYRAIQQVVVPTRVIMHSGHGTITLLLDDVAVNEDLLQAAFDPPRRASKQP